MNADNENRSRGDYDVTAKKTDVDVTAKKTNADVATKKTDVDVAGRKVTAEANSTSYETLDDFYKNHSEENTVPANNIAGTDLSQKIIYGATVATQHMANANTDGSLGIEAVSKSVDTIGKAKDVIETARQIHSSVKTAQVNKELAARVEKPADLLVDGLTSDDKKALTSRNQKNKRLKKDIKKGKYDSTKLKGELSKKQTLSVDDDLTSAKLKKKPNYIVNNITNKSVAQIKKANVDENVGLEGATKSVDTAVQVKRGISTTVTAATSTVKTSANFIRYLKTYKGAGLKGGAAKFGKDTLKVVGEITKKAAMAGLKSVGGILAPVALLIILALVLSSMFNATIASISGTMTIYPSEAEDLTSGSSTMGGLADSLYDEIENIEITWTHIDEFRYNPSKSQMQEDIYDYDMPTIMSYLSAKYQAFTIADVQAEIADIYAEMFDIEYREEIEVRYRPDGLGGTEPYDYYILHITLHKKTTQEVVEPKMGAEERELYDIYSNEELAGSQQLVINPLRSDWRPTVSSRFGTRTYTMHGVTVTDFHTGLDMQYPLGTPLYAGITGKITSVVYSDTGYGWHVRMQTAEGNFEVLYAHMSEIYVSTGDTITAGVTPIGLVGSTGWSSGPHLHIEVLIPDSGGTFRQQDPIYFVGYATGRS